MRIPDTISILVARIFNVLAWFPVLGLVLIYSYGPIAYIFGEYDDSVMHTDPKRFGIFLSNYFWISRMIAWVLVKCTLPVLVLFVLVILTGFFKKLNRKSVYALVISTAFVIPVFWCKFDPGGYLFWYFD